MSADPESKIGLFVFNQADEYHRRLAGAVRLIFEGGD